MSPLSCSVRVLPHHQDTGGFFIAVLHKSDWLPWQRRPRETTSEDTTTAAASGCSEEALRPRVLVGEEKEEGGEEGSLEGGEEKSHMAVMEEGDGEKDSPNNLMPTNKGEGGGEGEGETCSGQEKSEVKEAANESRGEEGTATTRPGTAILGRCSIYNKRIV